MLVACHYIQQSILHSPISLVREELAPTSWLLCNMDSFVQGGFDLLPWATDCVRNFMLLAGTKAYLFSVAMAGRALSDRNLSTDKKQSHQPLLPHHAGVRAGRGRGRGAPCGSEQERPSLAQPHGLHPLVTACSQLPDLILLAQSWD